MRSDRVVLPSPHFGQYLHLLQRVKDLTVQKLIPELPVETLRVAVLPWTARLDLQRFRSHVLEPVPNNTRSELGTVVRPDVFGNSPEHKQLGKQL
jgi:hypothetical protein